MRTYDKLTDLLVPPATDPRWEFKPNGDDITLGPYRVHVFASVVSSAQVLGNLYIGDFVANANPADVAALHEAVSVAKGRQPFSPASREATARAEALGRAADWHRNNPAHVVPALPPDADELVKGPFR